MITNFTLPEFIDGETILAPDINELAQNIHTVISLLISDNDRALLLPAGFDGNNEIETPGVANSLLMIDASKNATVKSLAELDQIINTCGEQSVIAAQSAASALESKSACLSILNQCQLILSEIQNIKAQIVEVVGGASAYDIAVAVDGFVGTQSEWLASLVGPSAYEDAIAEGFVGTRAEWLSSLQGADGELTELSLAESPTIKNLEELALGAY
jgi:hypothetical protein